MGLTKKRLDDEAITRALAELPGWQRRGDKIRYESAHGDSDTAMRFIEAVADVARDLDHHPELFNVYDRVELELTTHDADGLTDYDFEFARRVNAIDT